MMLTALVFSVSLLSISKRANAQIESSEEDTDAPENPWINSLQELQSITAACALKIPGFSDIATREEQKWQICMDQITRPITEKFPILDVRRARSNNVQDNEKVNSTQIYEIDKQLHMVICRNTTAYKSCWSGIIQALNKCEPGLGDVSGQLYFALYDDICREGGRLTVENRRDAALAGQLCERDYSTDVCKENRHNLNANDLCLRFHSNVACDLSSIDSNCTNKVDKGLHKDIFERVEKVLGCSKTFVSDSNYTYSDATISFMEGASKHILLILVMLVLVL